MIEMKPCRGCGRPLIYHSVANLSVRLETEPLDLNGIMGELAASRSLWMVDQGKVRPARPGEAGPLREHRCTAVSGPNGGPAVPAPPKGPQSPSEPRVAPSARSSGPSTDHSGARRAASPRSSRPLGEGEPVPCEYCGADLNDDALNAVVVELGATVMTAFHSEPCGRQ